MLKVIRRCSAQPELAPAVFFDLRPKHLQLDEVWTFVAKKARNVRRDDSRELGDQWVFVAIDAETKLIPSFYVGKRHREETKVFLGDLYNPHNESRRLYPRSELAIPTPSTSLPVS
jgi:hypothetical protein